MEFEYLSPVDHIIVKFSEDLLPSQIGYSILKNETNNFPDLKSVNLALIGVLDNRNDLTAASSVDISFIRKEFYRLHLGNWPITLADLGNINQGETSDDTFFALRLITESLIKLNIVPIIIGGSQDLTYPVYRSFDNLDQMVNLVCIDSKFDFGTVEDAIKADSYLSRIIADEPNNLFNFANIGFQTYYNAIEEINLIEKLYFESYRLGEISKNVNIAEPVLRDADVVSIDFNAIKSADSGNSQQFYPNGFDGKEICTLSRYAGISGKVKVFGIFNHNSSPYEAILIAQMIWYFIEGFTCRTIEAFDYDKSQAIKYIVPAEDVDIVFYKSNKSERWWMEVPIFSGNNNNLEKSSLLPCSYEEYLQCCNQQIPERWWKTQRKNCV